MSSLCMMHSLNALLTDEIKPKSAKKKKIKTFDKNTYKELANGFDQYSGMQKDLTFGKQLYYVNLDGDNIFSYGLKRRNIITTIKFYQKKTFSEVLLLEDLNSELFFGIIFFNGGHCWAYKKEILWDKENPERGI